MSSEQEQPADEPRTAPRRARRIYIWWGTALGLLVIAAMFSWLVVVPAWTACRLVKRCERGAMTRNDWVPVAKAGITEFGGPNASVDLLIRYLRLPNLIAPERELALDLIDSCRDMEAGSIEKAVPLFIEIMLDTAEDPAVRCNAMSTLGLIGHPKAEEPLRRIFRTDKSGRVRGVALWGLRRTAWEDSVEELLLGLKDPHLEVRREAVFGLGRIPDPRGVPGLIRLLKDPDVKQRDWTAWTLGEIKDRRAVPALIEALSDKEKDVRYAACYALAYIKDPAAIEALEKRLDDEKKQVRAAAKWSLGEIRKAQAAVKSSN